MLMDQTRRKLLTCNCNNPSAGCFPEGTSVPGGCGLCVGRDTLRGQGHLLQGGIEWCQFAVLYFFALHQMLPVGEM